MTEARGMIDPMDTPRTPGVPALPPTQHELPYDDGEPMESDRHYEQMHLLTESLDLWLGDREDCYVAGNRAVYFSLEQAKNQDFRAPDVVVVTGLTDGRKERLSWVAWEERGRLPDLVIEILSPSTERADRGAKRDVYAQIWRLPEYFVVDPASGRLEGWDLDRRARAFVPKQPDARGDLPAHALGLALGVRDLPCGKLGPPSLRWIGTDGAALPTGRERAAAAETELEQLRRR